jgi:hypothetical protein
MYAMLYVLAPARAGDLHRPTFFTHFVGEELYGGWYRVLSPTEVEVQGVGLLERVSWEGRSPEAAAQCCLEEFVNRRARDGEPATPLSEIAARLHEAGADEVHHQPRQPCSTTFNHRPSPTLHRL